MLICINNLPLEGNDIAPKLVIGEEYSLKSLYTCQCGQEHYDVGIPSHLNYVECYKCKTNIPDGNKIHWCHPSRFQLKTPTELKLQ